MKRTMDHMDPVTGVTNKGLSPGIHVVICLTVLIVIGHEDHFLECFRTSVFHLPSSFHIWEMSRSKSGQLTSLVHRPFTLSLGLNLGVEGLNP